MNLIYNGENRLSIYFSSARKKEANIGDHLKKGSNFEQRDREDAKTWGGGGLARGQKSLQKHFFVFLLYIEQFVSTPLSVLCFSKVVTEL